MGLYSSKRGVFFSFRTITQKHFDEFKPTFGKMHIYNEVSSLSIFENFRFSVSELWDFIHQKGRGVFFSFRTITQKHFHEFKPNFGKMHIYIEVSSLSIFLKIFDFPVQNYGTLFIKKGGGLFSVFAQKLKNAFTN